METECHDGEAILFIYSLVFERESLMAIVSVGIDLAKNVFAVYGLDETGKPALVRPSLPRAKLLEFIAALPDRQGCQLILHSVAKGRA